MTPTDKPPCKPECYAKESTATAGYWIWFHALGCPNGSRKDHPKPAEPRAAQGPWPDEQEQPFAPLEDDGSEAQPDEPAEFSGMTRAMLITQILALRDLIETERKP